MRIIISGILLFASLLPAQLTVAQREEDFNALAALVARYYAPLEWKQQVHGVDGLRIGPWLQRVRAARNDIEFRRICAEYLGQFKDGHVSFVTPTVFLADTLIRADIYEGKLLIYNFSAARYPRAEFPLIAVGNEVVSLDGRPALQIVDELVRVNPAGSGRGARRLAALNFFVRSQQTYPDAALLPDRSQLVVRNPEGEEATYTIQWTKSGRDLSAVPPLAKETVPQAFDADLKPTPMMLSLRPDLAEVHAVTPGVEPDPARAVLGYGARNPYFAMPANFVPRRGLAPADNFFSGTFMADGLRIGFIRIPNFLPANDTAALAEFGAEVTFFRNNTDGLVVDCSRNTGGRSDLTQSYYARLTTQPHYYTQFEALPTTGEVLGFDAIEQFANILSREQWVKDRWSAAAREIRRAWAAGERTKTAPIARFLDADSTFLTRGPLVDDNFPWLDNARQPIGYDKPLIVLADDLSFSGGDLFPSLFQDNRRGLVVGTRTGGLGGYVFSFSNALPHTQSTIRLTGGLMVRRNPVRVPGFPEAPYVEDLGVVPDVELDYQTRANLMNRGADFVAGFTRIIVQQIRAARP